MCFLGGFAQVCFISPSDVSVRVTLLGGRVTVPLRLDSNQPTSKGSSTLLRLLDQGMFLVWGRKDDEFERWVYHTLMACCASTGLILAVRPGLRWIRKI